MINGRGPVEYRAQNLANKHYYNRVFSLGIEPGLRGTGYIGLAVGP